MYLLLILETKSVWIENCVTFEPTHGFQKFQMLTCLKSDFIEGPFYYSKSPDLPATHKTKKTMGKNILPRIRIWSQGFFRIYYSETCSLFLKNTHHLTNNYKRSWQEKLPAPPNKRKPWRKYPFQIRNMKSGFFRIYYSDMCS